MKTLLLQLKLVSASVGNCHRSDMIHKTMAGCYVAPARGVRRMNSWNEPTETHRIFVSCVMLRFWELCTEVWYSCTRKMLVSCRCMAKSTGIESIVFKTSSSRTTAPANQTFLPLNSTRCTQHQHCRAKGLYMEGHHLNVRYRNFCARYAIAQLTWVLPKHSS